MTPDESYCQAAETLRYDIDPDTINPIPLHHDCGRQDGLPRHKRSMTKRNVIIDGHVHIYPGYEWHEAVSGLVNNLIVARGGIRQERPIIAGLLAESRTCHFYRDIAGQAGGVSHGAMHLTADLDSGCLTIHSGGEIQGYLIAGRQVVTAEKLELLALGADTFIADGLPTEATLAAIISAGSIPVLSWSPGKWFGRRGAMVRHLIETHPSDQFLIGDTGLRPTLWPFPRLMKLAQNRGFKIIGGSDALPLNGEEKWVGSYGVTAEAEFDANRPAASLRRILADPATPFTPIGKRARTAAFLSRWLRNQFARYGVNP